MSLLVGVFGLVILAQAPEPLVRSIQVAEVACSKDGWCAEFPGPLDVALAEGDGRRMVVGSTGGVLVLYEGGAWRPGLDTGLGRVTRLEVQADRVLACDDTRCVQVALAEGRLGPLVAEDVPRPRVPSLVKGTFGEGGRYELRNGRLQAFLGERRLFSRGADAALGGAGAPLWLVHGSTVWRYTLATASGPAAWTKFPIFCSIWCGGWSGRLFGDPHQPMLQLRHVLVEGLHAFDGTRFTPLLSPAFGPKEHPRPVVGAGCAPCLVGPFEVAIRRPDRWDFVSLRIAGPEGRRTERVPQGFWGCEVFPGEHGVFITRDHGGWMISKRWERFTPGHPIEATRYRVVEVKADDVLQVRRGPDPVAGSVASLAPGACVQGVGREVKATGGTWWRVKDAAGAEGWANARFLRAEPCPP